MLTLLARSSGRAGHNAHSPTLLNESRYYAAMSLGKDEPQRDRTGALTNRSAAKAFIEWQLAPLKPGEFPNKF